MRQFTLHQLIFAAVGWWVIFDPGESPHLPERNMLCIVAIEYNSNVSSGKYLIISALSTISNKTICLYTHNYQNTKMFLRNCINFKNLSYVRNHIKNEWRHRLLAGDWKQFIRMNPVPLNRHNKPPLIATIMWKESFHRNHVGTIGHRDVTIASGSCIGSITWAQMCTFWNRIRCDWEWTA